MEPLLIERFISAALKNKTAIKELKNCAVKAQQYEFAANVRDIEKENFPDSAEQKKAKELARKFSTLFYMIGVQAEYEAIYKIVTALTVYRTKRGKFDLENAAKIISDCEKYFY